MALTIVIAGSATELSIATAEQLASEGHTVLMDGGARPGESSLIRQLQERFGSDCIRTLTTDPAVLGEVLEFTRWVRESTEQVDVLLNAPWLSSDRDRITRDGLHACFAAHSIAPYLTTRDLLPLMGRQSKVVNLVTWVPLPSIARSAFPIDALEGKVRLARGQALLQSQRALSMWTRVFASRQGAEYPICFAVRRGSLPGVKLKLEDGEGFIWDAARVRASVESGAWAKAVRADAEALCRVALSDVGREVAGKCYDHESGGFVPLLPNDLSPTVCTGVVDAMERVLTRAL